MRRKTTFARSSIAKFPEEKTRIRMEQLPVIFKCSHHRKGNSDLAADLFLQGIKSVGGNAESVVLGDMDFKHCIGCLKCRTAENHRCIFAAQDNAQEMYQKIIDAPFTFFSAPIYFYHLPSRLKTFIDRGQWAFEAATGRSDFMSGLAERPAYACLVAGRPQGKSFLKAQSFRSNFFLDSLGHNYNQPSLSGA